MNDGSEAAELFNSNIFELSQLQGQLKRAKLQSDDAYRQTGDAFVLLNECRDLFEITALESPLRKDILDLIARIDSFKGD